MRPLSLMVVVALAVGHASLAVASGSQPILVLPQTFDSHEACVASLAAELARARAVATGGWMERGDGHIARQLVTNGVERLDANRARYASEAWVHSARRVSFERTQATFEIAHTFEIQVAMCAGQVKTVEGRRGFTLSTFASDLPALP
jgi:hypothetical protein